MIGGTKSYDKEGKMKAKAFFVMSLILLVAGCAEKKPMVISGPHVEPCPLPTGYKLGPAVEMVKSTLISCPNKLDQVFVKLLEISKHSPSKENGILIQDLLKEMIGKNKVSETYTRNLYQKYFSRRFVSIPDVKIRALPGEIDTIKKAMSRELFLKRIGMVECCNDKESYKSAEAEYLRAVNFMENLMLNEDYVKASR